MGQFMDRGSSYRPEIFYHSETQKEIAERSKEELKDKLAIGAAIVTQISPASIFYPAEEYHQDFYKKEGNHERMIPLEEDRQNRLNEVWGEADKHEKIFKSLVTVRRRRRFSARAAKEAAQEDIRTVKIGVVGERNEVWEHVQEQLEENNEPVRIKLVKFTEYVKPIQALEEGEIDLHAALTEIYMEQVNEDAGYSNTTIAYTTLNPMGLFPKNTHL